MKKYVALLLSVLLLAGLSVPAFAVDSPEQPAQGAPTKGVTSLTPVGTDTYPIDDVTSVAEDGTSATIYIEGLIGDELDEQMAAELEKLLPLREEKARTLTVDNVNAALNEYGNQALINRADKQDAVVLGPLGAVVNTYPVTVRVPLTDEIAEDFLAVLVNYDESFPITGIDAADFDKWMVPEAMEVTEQDGTTCVFFKLYGPAFISLLFTTGVSTAP